MGRVCSVLCLPQQVGHPLGCHLVGDREAARGSAPGLGQSAAPEGAQHPHVSRNHECTHGQEDAEESWEPAAPLTAAQQLSLGIRAQGQPAFLPGWCCQQGNCRSALKSNLWRGMRTAQGEGACAIGEPSCAGLELPASKKLRGSLEARC